MHDTFAWILSWVVIFVVPIAFILVIWKIHEIPEKLAEKRHHYNVEAVKFLSWVGLFTGGLLFPLAFVYAVMKPVSIQVTSKEEVKPPTTPPPPVSPPQSSSNELLEEIKKLQSRISDIESRGPNENKIPPKNVPNIPPNIPPKKS